jgi:type VI secretion system secreted protein Hcp
MALNSYLTITGGSQGDIRGDVTQRGREGMIMIIGWSHEIVSAIDSAGQPSRRQHRPFVVTKEIDSSTPKLQLAHTRNENLREVVLRAWRPSRSGAEEQYFTITLTNAKIVGIRMEMLNNKYPENMQHKEREHVSFTYQQISHRIEDGGIESESAWRG